MKKKLMTFLIVGLLIVFSGNVIAIQSNIEDTLDIEKVAIKTIDNSISLKTQAKQTELIQDQYYQIKDMVRNMAARGIFISVQTMIYDPIRAENRMNQAMINDSVSTNTLKVDAYSKYINLLKANYAVEIQEALNDSLEKANNKAQLQLSKGLISKSEARLIEINYQKSSYQLSSYQNNLDSAYMAVNLSMGENMAKRYKNFADSNIVPDKEIKSLDDYIAAALVNRGEIINAQSSFDASQKELEYDKSTTHTDYNAYIKQKQYEVDKAAYDLEESKIKVQIELTNGYKTLQAAMKALENQQISYDAEESDYEAAKVKYSNGLISLNQLQDAEISKAQAQISLKNAQLDAWLEQTKFEDATGIGPALK